MSPQKSNPYTEVIAFGFVLVLVGLPVLFWFLLSGGLSYEDLTELYRKVELLRQKLPEGEPLYSYAYEFAKKGYEIKLYLAQRYDSPVKVLIDLFKGNLTVPVTPLLLSFAVNYVLALGILKALSVKFLWAFLISLGGLVLFGLLRLFLSLGGWTSALKARLLDPFGDGDVRTVLRVLIENPRPASIGHHMGFEGGLLKHSLAVAKRATEKVPEEKKRDAFLAGLLHDAGKLKIYRKREDGSWERIDVAQEVANKLAIRELEKRFGIGVPKDSKVWKAVKEADMEETTRELRESGIKADEDTLVRALERLRINDPASADGWTKEELPFVVVLAHALNSVVSELLLEKNPDLPISPHPDNRGVHPIAYARPYEKFVLTSFGKAKADELDLFDAKVGNTVFKAVYLIDKSFVPEYLLKRWGSTEKEIDVRTGKRSPSS